MRHGARIFVLTFWVLVAMTGCDSSSDPSCRSACNEVEEYAQSGNWNAPLRLTPCGELCAHPVARSFERCCAERAGVMEWLGCEEHATNSLLLTDDQSIIWEWVLTGITFVSAFGLVRIEGVMAVSDGAAAGCLTDQAVELAYEFTVATGEATVHEPVAVTPISLDEYEAAKWDVVVDRDRAWYPEVPDLGALTGGRLIFQEHLTLLDDWANQWATLYVSMDLLGGPQVDWRLLLPPCQEL